MFTSSDGCRRASKKSGGNTREAERWNILPTKNPRGTDGAPRTPLQRKLRTQQRAPSIDLREAAQAAADHAKSPGAPPPLPWMEWNVGERVVVRFREKDYRRDALGTLLEKDPHYVVIDTKRGPVKVMASTMVVGRKVLPPRRRFKPLPPMQFPNSTSEQSDST